MLFCEKCTVIKNKKRQEKREMSGRLRKILAMVLAVLLMTAVLSVPAFADDGQKDMAKRWNIMLVIDGSGSLYQTDPDKLRYEAIDSFLAVLQSEGNCVGAIVFSGNGTEYDSDEYMRRGIMLDTGLIELDAASPNGGDAKSYLSESIRAAGVAQSREGATDIGTALLAAQERLSELDNGNDSAIFLFTDGETDLKTPGTLQKSQENLKTATGNINAEGIKLCGVYLNDQGKTNSKEVRSIVCQANGISDSNLNLGDMYVEITDATSCASSTDKFMSMLGFSVPDGDYDIIYSSADRSFRVPGVGVEEANIRLRTVDGNALPDTLDVTITAPDGTVLSGASAAAICTSSKTYRNYKISAPMSGTWTVHIEIPGDNQIGISYAPIFSTYVGASISVSPAADQLHVNMDAKVTAKLTQDGKEITDSNAYKEYTCKLTLTDTSNGEKTEYDIPMNGNGEFVYTLPLETYGVFDAQVSFECDKVNPKSDIQLWDLTNRAPHGTAYKSGTLTYGLFQSATCEVDLAGEFTDAEDGSNLTLSLDSARSTCNTSAVTVSGQTLKIKAADFSSEKESSLIVYATDTQGAYAEMKINITTKNMTVPYILMIVAAIIVIFLIILFYLRSLPKLTGECTIEFEYDDKSVTCKLPLLGSECKRSMDVASMIALPVGQKYISEGCREAKISSEEVMTYLSGLSELSKVKLSVAKGKDGRKTVGIIRVKQGKGRAQNVYDSQVRVGANGEAITIGYYSAGGIYQDDESFVEDDDPFGSNTENHKVNLGKEEPTTSPFDDD